MNRLSAETSPYLLQHALNPVHWYSWSEEAFEAAQAVGKPIFLSIGYSTCHWCHVMAKESFEDEEVAELLNVGFVCIKVDREEMPHVDNLYMTFCSMATGSGGWPLTVFLTPQKKPFFAGTYFPKSSLYGKIGMLDLLPRILMIWQRDEVLADAERIMNMLARNVPRPIEEEDFNKEGVSDLILENTLAECLSSIDSSHGGTKGLPKFPQPHLYLFLLSCYDELSRTGERNKDAQKCLDAVSLTLMHMRCGGVYDQIGFGFHRYSIDEEWLVPHYEKMLYDQAMLAYLFVEAYERTKNALFRRTAEEIFEFVFEELSAEGAATFYAAQDARREYYVWESTEIDANFPGESCRKLKELFHISDKGNFTEETAWNQDGYNILHIDVHSTEALPEVLEHFRHDLLQLRGKRSPPDTDTKVLTDWNAMMVVSLLRCGRILDKPEYIARANAILDELAVQCKEGKIFHIFRERAPIPGLLDDYAYLTWALIEDYDRGRDKTRLEWACRLMDHVLDHFWESDRDDLFQSPDYVRDLPLRIKNTGDEPYPSGYSVTLLNLRQLAKLTENTRYHEASEKLMRAGIPLALRLPTHHGFFLRSALQKF